MFAVKAHTDVNNKNNIVEYASNYNTFYNWIF